MRASCWFLCLKKSAITFGEGCTGKNPVALKIQGAPPIVDPFVINNANDFTLRGKIT